jgi:hypothetical protein
MNIKEWLKANKMRPYTLSQHARLAPSTIWNLIRGRPPWAKTVKTLVESTKNFMTPITFDMFPRVYSPGTRKTITGPELFKRLMEESLKLKRSAFKALPQKGSLKE